MAPFLMSIVACRNGSLCMSRVACRNGSLCMVIIVSMQEWLLTYVYNSMQLEWLLMYGYNSKHAGMAPYVCLSFSSIL